MTAEKARLQQDCGCFQLRLRLLVAHHALQQLPKCRQHSDRCAAEVEDAEKALESVSRSDTRCTQQLRTNGGVNLIDELLEIRSFGPGMLEAKPSVHPVHKGKDSGSDELGTSLREAARCSVGLSLPR